MNLAEKETMTTLSNELQEYLKEEPLVILTTMDKETKEPNIAAISWVKPVNEKAIRFAVTNNSRIVNNIQTNEKVVFTVIGLENVFAIYGTAKILEETMENVSLKLAKIEVEIDEIFESMFWGAKIEQNPTYVKTYNPDAAKKLDHEVYTALLK